MKDLEQENGDRNISAGDIVVGHVGCRQEQLLLKAGAGFQNSATGAELGFYAARSYSLMRPPRTSRLLIRWWERSATG